jgi:septal ring factor EnvC (AmiA/AmiB activator)
MTITTEEAEEAAAMLEGKAPAMRFVFTGYTIAAALRSLAAERDALKVERDSWITKYNTQVDYRIRAEAEFSHMQRRIARQRRALAKLYAKRHDRKAERDALRAENEKLRAAFQKYFGQSEATNVRAALGEKDDAKA